MIYYLVFKSLMVPSENACCTILCQTQGLWLVSSVASKMFPLDLFINLDSISAVIINKASSAVKTKLRKKSKILFIKPVTPLLIQKMCSFFWVFTCSLECIILLHNYVHFEKNSSTSFTCFTLNLHWTFLLITVV